MKEVFLIVWLFFFPAEQVETPIEVTVQIEEPRAFIGPPTTEELLNPVKPDLPAIDEDYVEINLDEMRVTLFKDGAKHKEFPVLSKGNEQSTWRTPRGDFAALYKVENHFSSIGKVWMPNSIQFKGDFFIHGWPYYPNGDPIPEGYSGGCIRIDTEDMKEIYNFTKLNMPILVE